MILVHFDKEIEGWNFEMMTHVASSNLDFVDEVAQELGAAPLSKFILQVPNYVCVEGPWFSTEEGLKTLQSLLNYLETYCRSDGLNHMPRARRIRRRGNELDRFGLLPLLHEELEDLQAQLRLASAQGANCHFRLL